MSQLNNANSAYSAASKMVSSLGAVVMLYDAVLRAVYDAKGAIEKGQIEARFHATQRASKIILGLQANLDFEKGGNVALVLDRYYHRVFGDLQRLNVTSSAKACDDLIASLMEVRNSWKTLVEQESADSSKKKAAPSASAAAPESQPQSGRPLTISV